MILRQIFKQTVDNIAATAVGTLGFLGSLGNAADFIERNVVGNSTADTTTLAVGGTLVVAFAIANAVAGFAITKCILEDLRHYRSKKKLDLNVA